MKEILSNILSFSQGIISSLDSSNENDGFKEQKASKHKQTVVLVNYAAMLYLVLDSLILHLTTVYASLPFVYRQYYGDEDSLFWGRVISWFIYVNFMANYVMVVYGSVQSVYCSRKDLPFHNVQSHEEFEHCKHCDRRIPLRARHCSICDRCILKRDHHCYFTGSCIGFYNQRYFICLTFYGLMGSLYGLYYLHWYLSSSYVTLFSIEFYKYMLPYTLVTWVIGFVDFATVLLLVLFYMTVVGSLGCAYFFIWQWNLVITGQTSYEFMRGKKQFQSTFSHHVRSIFGPYWILNFIFPMPFLKSEEDGLTWKNHSTKFL